MTSAKIKILHAVTSPLSLGLMRGQLGYLRNAGFDAVALCSPGPQVEEVRAREPIPVLTVPMAREVSPFADIVSLVKIWRVLREFRPTVSNVGTPKAGLLVGFGAWLSRVPCRVYTMRGLRLETAAGLKRQILRTTERIACACAHRVVCVSPSLRQRAVELGLVSPKKTIVLGAGSSNGVEAARFAPTPERLANAISVRRKLGIEDNRVVIGYVGRLTRDKGIPELSAAFQSVRQSFPQALLLLVGSYEKGDPLDAKVCAAIESDRNVIQVEFTADTALYYLLMDVFVLPSHREGFPNTVLEAQAAERSVVTTNATGATDSVQDGITGLLVPVRDSAALAEAIKKLLSDRSLAQRLACAGRERVMREFRQEIVWEQLNALYRKLLQERGLLPTSALNAETAMLAGKQG